MRCALLAYEMGLGKTPISITAAKLLNVKNPLITCPLVAVTNWHREWKRFWPDFQGTLSVIPYSQVHNSWPHAYPYDLAILDECHYLKTPTAQRTKAVLGKSGMLRGVKGPIWALSGTPAPNNPSELWALLYTFGVTKLTFDDWCASFCEQRTFKVPGKGIVARQITGTKLSAVPQLKKLLEPVMLRKKKEEVLNLPPITFESVSVSPGPVDMEISVPFVKYISPFDRREELFAKLEKEANLMRTVLENIGHYGAPKNEDRLQALEAMAGSISTLRMYSGCQKIDPVAELVSAELATNAYDKLVIFALHRDVIEGLRIKLVKFKPVTLYGGTDPRHRQSNIDKFQNLDKHRVFIGNIHAAGTAITLTRASQVLFVEMAFTPGDNAQAMMRCHRIGQKKSVHVRFVSLDNPIDEKVTEIIRKKTRELALIFDKPTPDEPEHVRDFRKLIEKEQNRILQDMLS